MAMMSRANVSFDVNHAEKHFYLIKIMVRHLRGKKKLYRKGSFPSQWRRLGVKKKAWAPEAYKLFFSAGLMSS